jgi:Arc/MetJ-type ribon-helix-helix transcriptional regulator
MSTQTQKPAGELTAQNEEFISREIGEGRYQSRSDVLNAGVEALRRQALLTLIEESRRQLDEGECTVYDDAGLEKRLADLHARIDAIAGEREVRR